MTQLVGNTEGVALGCGGAHLWCSRRLLPFWQRLERYGRLILWWRRMVRRHWQLCRCTRRACRRHRCTRRAWQRHRCTGQDRHRHSCTRQGCPPSRPAGANYRSRGNAPGVRSRPHDTALKGRPHSICNRHQNGASIPSSSQNPAMILSVSPISFSIATNFSDTSARFTGSSSSKVST